MNAIEETNLWEDLEKFLKNSPNVILCISAHIGIPQRNLCNLEKWNDQIMIFMDSKRTFEVEYPAKGNPGIKKETVELWRPPTGKPGTGSWSLERGQHLYPAANIPVIQMSIDYTQSA